MAEYWNEAWEYCKRSEVCTVYPVEFLSGSWEVIWTETDFDEEYRKAIKEASR